MTSYNCLRDNVDRVTAGRNREGWREMQTKSRVSSGLGSKDCDERMGYSLLEAEGRSTPG